MTSFSILTPAGRLTRLALVLVALLASSALVACGGDDEEDDQQAVEEVALGYGESDGAEACEFMSASALDQLGGESGCTEQFEDVPPAEFEVQEVTVDGDSATASVENVESEQVIELEFVNEDDEWKLSSFPGLETVAPPEGEDGELTPPEGDETTAPEGDETAPEGDETDRETVPE